jgi:hypothetical protein
MNQRFLYDSLDFEGCKILSFEDYPSDYSSWRANFMISNISREVSCNRKDRILNLSSKSHIIGNQMITLSSRELVSDQLEILKVIEWIRSLTAADFCSKN